MRTRLPFFLLSICVAMLAGCVWRGEYTEYYFGPVFFRHIEPPKGKALVNQQIHFPILLEAGRQWGLSIGAVDRRVGTPVKVKNGKIQSAGEKTAKWSSFFSLPFWDWELSPFFLRIEVNRATAFNARSMIGLQLGAGEEHRSLTVGYSRTTKLYPYNDSVTYLQYGDRHPLAMEFTVCSSELSQDVVSTKGCFKEE